MSKNKKIFVIIIAIIAILFLWAFIRGPEDTWICENGQWVKHGAPSASMPEGDCNWLDTLNPFK